MNYRILRLVASCTIAATLIACTTGSLVTAKDTIRFIDLQQFDDELSHSLGAIKTPIEVNFVAPPSPNEIPPRLERWISHVSALGGKVDLVLPEDELIARNPVAIISIMTSIVKSADFLFTARSDNLRKRLLENREIKLHLARDRQGNLRITKVVFDPRVTAK